MQGLVYKRNCEAQGCSTLPSFGFLGEKPRRCKAHALEGMVCSPIRWLCQHAIEAVIVWN